MESIPEEEAKSEKSGVSVSTPESSSSTVKSLAAALSMQFASGGPVSPTVAVSQNTSVTSTSVATEVRGGVAKKMYNNFDIKFLFALPF